MNQNLLKIIGIKDLSRKEALLFSVSDVEGLTEILEKNFNDWSDFDSWLDMGVQQWIFARSLDLYRGKQIDIKCDCCEYCDLSISHFNNIRNLKCYGIKCAYMIEKVFNEILLAKSRRNKDGTYSA